MLRAARVDFLGCAEGGVRQRWRSLSLLRGQVLKAAAGDVRHFERSAILMCLSLGVHQLPRLRRYGASTTKFQ